MPENLTQEDLEKMSPEEIRELQKKNCIFCKIIKNEIPSKKVYEDDDVLVILDINPASEGHLLILPKEHFMIMPNMPKELVGHMFVVAREVSQSILKTLDVEGTTVFVANGQIAGQKSPHFMIHVIPRKENDGLFELKEKEISEEKQKKLQEALTGIIYKAMTGREPQEQEPKEEQKQEPEEKEENKEEPKTEEQPQKEEQEKPNEEQQSKEEQKTKHKPEKTPDLNKISCLFLNK